MTYDPRVGYTEANVVTQSDMDMIHEFLIINNVVNEEEG